MCGKSVNRFLAVLKNCLQTAVLYVFLQDNPCEKVARVREKSMETQVFTLGEQRKKEQMSLSGKREYIGFYLALHTGARVGELVALKWTDVDFKRRFIYVTKTKSGIRDNTGEYVEIIDEPKTKLSKREIPMSAYTTELMKKNKLESSSEYVVSDKFGNSFSVRAYKHKFERFLKQNGIRELSFHSLRHTFATRGIERGADVKTVSALMGHTDTHVTLNRYVHSLIENKRRVIRL